MKKSVLILATFALLFGCNSAKSGASASDSTAVGLLPGMVMVSNDPEPEPIPVVDLIASDHAAKAVQFHDPAQLDSVKLIGATTLEFLLQFGGGCEAHDITAHVQTPTTDGLDIYLGHNAHDDRCEAWLSRLYRIDLTAQLKERQQSGHGKMQVRFYVPEDSKTVAATIEVPY